jgi:hypothetical protein
VVAAVVMAARGFRTAALTPPENQAVRDGHLGWTSAALAASSVLSLTGGILTTIYYSDVGVTTNLTDGLGVAIAGDAIAVPGAVLAAVAFFRSAQRQERGETDWFGRRDRLLGTGIGVFAFGLFLVALGAMMVAGAYDENGLGGLPATAAWLSSVGLLAIAGGAACASIGFLRSRPAPVAPITPQ